MPPIRLGVVSTHPAHYHAPLYRELARSEALAPTVLFTDRARCESYRDPDLGELRTGIDRFEGYDWEVVEPRVGGAAGAAAAVARRILAGRFDAVVLTALNQPASWTGLAACRLAGTVPIVKAEGDLLRGRSGPAAALKAALRRAFGAGVACALYSCGPNRDYLVDAGVDPEHLVFVPAAVDAEHLAELARGLDREALRAELGLEGSTVFLFVGRLTARKRPGDLLAAVRRVRESGREGRWVVVGDGPLRAALEQRAGEGVRFTGTLGEAELVRWYEAADVLVVPSAWDPSPKVLNEAMVFGNACLVSDRVGSGRDLVRGGENGFVYRAGDAEALAERTIELADLPAEETRRMGERSREIVSDWTYGRGRRELEDHLTEHHFPSP